MLIGAYIWAIVPLAVNVTGGTENPFFFNTGWRIGGFLASALFLLVRYRDLIFTPAFPRLSPTFTRIIWPSIIGWSILYGTIGKIEYAFLAASTQFISVRTAAVVFEMWPLVMVICAGVLFKSDERYQKNLINIAPLMCLCLLGFAFVTFSEGGGTNTTDIDIEASTMVGFGLAGLAAFLGGSHTAVIIKWGADLGKRLFQEHKGDYTENSLDLFGLVLGHCVVQLFSIAPSFAVGVVRGESLTFSILFLAAAGGILSSGLGDFLFRKANSITDNLGVNAISYAAPIFALLWLLPFTQFDWQRFDFVVIGTIAIITGNLIINFEAEIKWGFKSLIITLWACGAFVYMRDDLLRLLPFDTWLWPGEPFFGALGMSATVFTLLLSFRVARLAGRTQDEDNAIFVLFQNLDLLARRGVIDGRVREHILAIDASHSPEELRTAYWQAKTYFTRAIEANPAADDMARLAEAEAQLNTIVHSRRHGIEFGELFALIIFGGITVLLAPLARPGGISGWAGFIIEVFAFSFSAVIVFLLVNVWDLQRDRTNPILQRDPDYNRHGVIFRDARNRGFEQGTSIVIGIAITAAYTALLWQKWLT